MGGGGLACVRGRRLDLTLYRKGLYLGVRPVWRTALGLCGEGL